MRERALVLAGLVLVIACKRHDDSAGSAAAPSETCATTLPPGDVVGAPFTPFVVPRSRLVIEAEMKLGGVERELEKKVPKRVAEERNHDIGVAGHMNFTVDRGPFTARVQGDSLSIETPLRGHAEICASGRCYASCDPEAKAIATVPLRLTPEYRFGPSKVRIAITRGCELRALGGLVRIDVTGVIEPELRRKMGGIERDIDAKMPDLRADRMWQELSKPRALPLGRCFRLGPLGIAQGPVSGTPELLRVRFGVAAEPELALGSCEAGAAKPLPRLEQDPGMARESDVHLALVSPMSAATNALTAMPGAIDLGGARARIATAEARGARFALGLRGEVCGPIGLDSGLRWSEDAKTIRFDAARVAAAPQGAFDWEALARAVEKDAQIFPLATPEELRIALPGLATMVNDPDVTVEVSVQAARGEAAGLRKDALVAVVGLTGSVVVKEK